MPLIQEVRITPKRAEAFAGVLGPESVERVRSLAADLKARLDGRTIWNVNSTAAGGGVAEMLHTLLAYARGLGVDTRWLVMNGGPDFFRITKRIHNALHGEPGDGSELDRGAAEIYELVAARNAAELVKRIRPRDVVILHDPQTAGLIPHLVKHRTAVVWRCHVGNDTPGAEDGLAWGFLEPYLKQAHAFVFSRFNYLPDVLYHGRCLVEPPTLDPFSPKNQELGDDTIRSILVHAGLVGGPNGGPRTYTRSDGSRSTVARQADVLREGEPPAFDVPLVVQVSRWDRLKDPTGVLRGFVRAMAHPACTGAELVLAGPALDAASDDPEGAGVFDEVREVWRSLPIEERRRVHLVNLPMADVQENAVMVNALQRHATVVTQKSVRQGFGLTVTEAMWKARPVIASAVGGIGDQIEHGVSGLLLKNTRDLDAFGGAITQLLANPGFALRLGRNARRRVARNYLGIGIIAQYDHLMGRLAQEMNEVTTSVAAH
jgi:trehalose synthase